jgi:predicted ATPase
VQLPRELDDSKLLVQAHWALGLSAQYIGEFVTAVEHLEESIALYEPEKHDRDIKLYGGILNRGHLGRVLVFMGYADRGRRLIREGVAAAEEARNPLGHCNALTIAAFADVLHRNIEALEQLAAVMHSLSVEHDFPHYRAHADCLSGYALAKLGDAQKGIEMLLTGITGHRSADTLQQLTYYYALLAEAFSAAGKFDEAMKALDEAEETSTATNEHFWDAEILRLKGVILGDHGEDSLRRAIEIARQQSAKTFELRASIGLARLWLRHERHKEARSMLLPIVSWFSEGLDTPDFREAMALIED